MPVIVFSATFFADLTVGSGSLMQVAMGFKVFNIVSTMPIAFSILKYFIYLLF